MGDAEPTGVRGAGAAPWRSESPVSLESVMFTPHVPSTPYFIVRRRRDSFGQIQLTLVLPSRRPSRCQTEAAPGPAPGMMKWGGALAPRSRAESSYPWSRRGRCRELLTRGGIRVIPVSWPIHRAVCDRAQAPRSSCTTPRHSLDAFRGQNLTSGSKPDSVFPAMAVAATPRSARAKEGERGRDGWAMLDFEVARHL